MECLPNRLTPFNFEIYYKEENYLKVRTAVFKYITPPYSKGWVCWYVSILVCLTSLYSHVLAFWVLTIWLSYPSSYSFTGFISPTSCVLILTKYKSSFSTCTLLLIKFVTFTPSSLSLFLKSSFISKSLIRGVLCFILI